MSARPAPKKTPKRSTRSAGALRDVQERADAATDPAERDRLLREGEAIERGDDPAPTTEPTPEPKGEKESSSFSLPNVGGSGATVVLGFFAWVWLILPALTNGADGKPAGLTGTKNVLRAKFLNIGPDGKRLP